MKKLIIGIAAGFVLVASSAMANGTPAPQAPAEGVEISGNVTVVTGYQHDDKDAVGSCLGGACELRLLGNGAGVPGVGTWTAPNADTFKFVVDQVELDLQKSFGENIRLRADLDFGDFGNTSWRVGDFFDLEQGYVTANIGWGNGVEFLIGKFNAPIGVDSVDRNENWLISYASPFRYFVPRNITGAKIYYAFSDLIDLHVYVVNDLNGGDFFDSALPSMGFRLGFNWGSEEKKNTVGLSGAGGPENALHNAHWDFLVDADLMIAASDSVTVAAEAVFRQTNSITGGANQKAIAGFAAVNWQASDAWDLTFRGDFVWDINPPGARGGSGASTTGANWIGYEGWLVAGTVGAGYKIADGAKMKLEYRFDYASTAGPALNSDYHSVMAEFAYTF